MHGSISRIWRWVSSWGILFSNPFVIILFLCASCFCAELNAQNSFSFLTLPNNARLNAMGGVNVSLSDKDLNLHVANPALLDTAQGGQIGFNYSPYLAQSNFFSLNYAPRSKNNLKNSQWGISLQNLNYGSFQGMDAIGNLTDVFSANDFSLGVTHARRISHISFGVSAKLVGSVLESYNSMAVLTDWGGTFKHPEYDLNIGIVAKNVGFVVKSYGNVRPDIPFDLQLGASFKPAHMPVRFSLTAHHLYVFDIAYNDHSFNYTYDNQGNKVSEKISVADQMLRHLVVGTEFLVHKNFRLMAGYNHLLHKELAVNNLGSAGGLSFGGNIRLNQFGFSFSRAVLTNGKGYFTFSLIYDSPAK
ncbi:type IX secretion system protein PorQ [Emticicia sp. 21SJ11W-3]|uniref:type IX secretion system protein PorQ n=1 Tax=Emticicia sp. 21SJ11W-3 TaxID=2916755 RepID=UPI00209D7E67|nr:type IX secretion system protein PorQ [Emticicia sp. 21SJ11W-3]UTA69447.1 type IX secretion system protein PorQ [Emticicia sp. 21SJ11W-3]